MSRTGLKGKGILRNSGPNYACDPVITRVDPSVTARTQVLVCTSEASPGVWCLPGGTVEEHGIKIPSRRRIPELLKTILFHNISQSGSGWNGILEQVRSEDDGDLAPLNFLNTPIRQWGAEQAMKPGKTSSNERQQAVELNSQDLEAAVVKEFTSYLVNNGKLVYKGYCDDPRNTDDAWMETSVYHCHLPNELAKFLGISEDNAYWKPQESTLKFQFRWMDVDSGLPTYKNLYASHFHFVELCVPFCLCGRRKYDSDDGSHQSQIDGSGADTAGHSSAISKAWRPEELPGGGDAGHIQFLGMSTHSNYIRARVSSDFDVLHVRSLLGAFGLQAPRALFALTGGAQDFDMDKKSIEAVFHQGLLRAAFTAGACIIDGGTDAGVMKLVGEAVDRNDHRVDLIGVLGWGIAIGRECMMTGGGGGLAAAQGAPREKTFYSKTQPNSSCGAGLDPNHRYLLLVDDGSAGKFGTEIKARSLVEDILRNSKKFDEFTKIRTCANSMFDPDKVADVTRELETWKTSELISLHRYLQVLVTHQPSIVGKTMRLKAGSSVSDALKLSSASKGNALQAVSHLMQRRLQNAEIPLMEQDLIDAYNKELTTGNEANTAGSQTEGDISILPASGMDFGAEGPCVENCFKCSGAYRDNISLIKYMNSIPRKQYDEWFKIQKQLNSPAGQHFTAVKCKGCEARILRDDFLKERFDRCSDTSCDYYFFRSRAVDLRQRGRTRIICESCRARANLDDILGKFIPGVLVVVQGGPGTIKTVASTNAKKLQSHTKPQVETLEQSTTDCTPIVVVEGSGKAADFISFTWRHMHEGTKKCYGCARSSCVAMTRRYKDDQLLPASCPVIEDSYKRIFGEPNALHVSWVIETCRRKDTISLFNPSSVDAGLDFAIMRAICKGTLRDGEALSTVQKLLLAIDWDLADEGGSAALAVEREILADETDLTESARALRKQALLYALRKNSWRSVQLLIQAGVSLPNRDSTLKGLYPSSIVPSSNEATVVPNSLHVFMSSEEVQKVTKQRVYDNYKRGRLTDEPQVKGTDVRNSYAWEHVKHSIFRVNHQDPSAPAPKDAESYFILDTEGTARLRPEVKFEEFCRHVDNQNFERELFGTKTHVDAVMHVLGFDRAVARGERADEESSFESELFLWSVLMGRTELALFFWRRCTAQSWTHSITYALFVSAVARRMAAIVDEQAAKQLIRDASDAGGAAPPPSSSERSAGGGGGKATLSLFAQFEDLAKRLMQKCFVLDHQTAVDAIQMEWWGADAWLDVLGPAKQRLSPLQLAGYAQAESFVDDPAFQSCVDNVWYGSILLQDVLKKSRRDADAEYVELPFRRGSWLQSSFLWFASGGASVPALLLAGLYSDFGQFSTCAAAVGGTYGILILCVVFLSFFYHTGRDEETSSRGTTARGWAALAQDAARRFSLRYLARTCFLFYSAPVIKFATRRIHYLTFVLLYTYVGIELSPFRYSAAEAVMHGWMLLLFVSEVRQLVESGYHRWAAEFWNWLDAAIFFLYAVAFAFRVLALNDLNFRDGGGYVVDFKSIGGFNPASGVVLPLDHQATSTYQYQFQDLMEGRGLHGLVGILLWLRLLEILRVDGGFGPLVLILHDMMLVDVSRFGLVLFILMCGFGSAFVCAARSYPDQMWRCNGGPALGSTFEQYGNCSAVCVGQCHKQLWRYLSQSLSVAYFEIYGEHFLDSGHYFAFDNQAGDTNQQLPTSNRFLGPTILAAYLLISSLVLTNLLIAMMNTTYTSIQAKSQQKWRYQRMELALEMMAEPCIPPPFNLPFDLWTICFGNTWARKSKPPVPQSVERKMKEVRLKVLNDLDNLQEAA